VGYSGAVEERRRLASRFTVSRAVCEARIVPGVALGLISLNALSIDASTLEAALKDAFGGWCTRS